MSDRAIVVIRVIKTFLCSSSVYSCHLFFISSASVRSLPFLSFIVPILAWNVPLICSVFMKRPLIFPILLFSSISLHCSFKKASSSPSLLFPGTLHSVRYLSRFLPCLLFFFSPQLFVKPPQTTTLLSCISFFFFFLRWVWSLPLVQCHELLSIVLQTLWLPDLIPSISLSSALYNHKGFDLGPTWMA